MKLLQMLRRHRPEPVPNEQSREDVRNSIHIIVLGAPSSGKECLLHYFCYSYFAFRCLWDEGVADSFTKVITDSNGSQTTFEMYILGTPDWYFLENRMGVVDAVLFTYSVTSLKTFKALPSIHKSLCERSGPEHIPMFLAGTMADKGVDLPPFDLSDRRREVQYADGQSLAKELGCIGFAETSAAHGLNCDKPFLELAKSVAEWRMKEIGRWSIKPMAEEDRGRLRSWWKRLGRLFSFKI